MMNLVFTVILLYFRTVAAAEVLKLATSQKIVSSLEASKRKPMEQKPDSNLGVAPGIGNVTESLPKTSEVTETKRPPLRVQQNRYKEQDRTCGVREGVSQSVEARRLAWMKDNQSWR